MEEEEEEWNVNSEVYISLEVRLSLFTRLFSLFAAGMSHRTKARHSRATPPL